MEARSIVQAVVFQVRPIQSRRDGTEVVATATASLMFDLSEHQIVKPKHSGTELTRKAHVRQLKPERYAIKFVADMDKAVKFHRDVLGLKVKFESPGWSEFVTGKTTLALHAASDKNPAGKVELGFTVADVEVFYRDLSAKGVLFSMPPKKQDFGGVLAQFVDSEGAHCSVGAEAA